MFNSKNFASQIAQVLYEKEAPINTLKRVLAINVGNAGTKGSIQVQLYTAANGLVYETSGPQIFVYGIPEYEGLLGTRIGSIVAYLVLGGFPRGTRRISQITVWFSEIGELNLQFDVVKVKASVKAKAPAKPKALVKTRRRSSDDDEGRPKKRKRVWYMESYDGPAKRTRLAVRTVKRKGGTA